MMTYVLYVKKLYGVNVLLIARPVTRISILLVSFGIKIKQI